MPNLPADKLDGITYTINSLRINHDEKRILNKIKLKKNIKILDDYLYGSPLVGGRVEEARKAWFFILLEYLNGEDE